MIRAPATLPFDAIETALRRHHSWILTKLRCHSSPPPPIDLSDGAQIPYLGGTLHLHISTIETAIRSEACWHSERELHLSLTQHADTQCVLEQALKDRARQIYTPRLTYYCQRIQRLPPPLRISSARTRWGSAGSRRISLNWRLLHFGPEIIDHVIAHEVAHLREANHGQRFYQLLALLDPDYQAHSVQLRRLGQQLPHFKPSFHILKERL